MTIESEQGSSSSHNEKDISPNQKLQGGTLDGENISSAAPLTNQSSNGPVVNRLPYHAPDIPQFLVTFSGSRDSGIPDQSSDCPTPVSAISGASGDYWAPSSPAASLNLGLASPSSLMDDSSMSEKSPNLVVKQEASNSALEGVLSVMSDSSDTGDKSTGGPLWTSTNDKAALGGSNPLLLDEAQFAQMLAEQTQSPTRCQAEMSTSVPVSPNNGTYNHEIINQMKAVFISSLFFQPGTRDSDNDDPEVRAALVDKRIRIVQLVAVGCMTVFSGLAASVWSQVSCAFFEAEVIGYTGGGDDDTVPVAFEENLRYGLWRYAPGGDGEESCTSYGYDDEADATVIPRLAGVVAIMGGLMALGILFAYLICGYAKKKIWEVAVVLAVMAGVSQLSTLLFLVVGVCEKYECIPGPGSMGTVISGFSYFILGFEMLYNMPRDSYAFESGNYPPHERPSTILRDFEMSDIHEWLKSYFGRIGGGARERQLPSLNAFHRRRHHENNPLGEGILENDVYDPNLEIV